MDSSSDNIISEFEENSCKKNRENKKFESLTEEEISEKIDKIKQNCFILKLKNEIFENYLRRHNFGALRELNSFLKSECHETSIVDRFDDDEETAILKSKELLEYTSKVPESTDQENIGFLIKVVEQEISELCLKSKEIKKIRDKKVVSLTADLESYNAQIEVLEEVYGLLKEQYPNNLKFHHKERATKILELIKFMESLIKRANLQIRKTSLASHVVEREYLKLCRDEYIQVQPISVADVKLLEIENEKLKSDLEKDNKVYLDLKYLLDNYQIKLKNENASLMKLKKENLKLEKDVKIYDKRLISLENYHQRLQKEVENLKAEKNKLMELGHDISKVPTPKEYIMLYENLKKINKHSKD